MIFYSTPILEITLPVDIKTQNTGRGNHWGSAASARRKHEKALSYEFRREPFDHPVGVLYTRICGKGQRAWDNDNLALALKQLQDALTELGWWHDDSDKWLKVIGYRHETTRRQDGPAVMVSVWRME